MWVIDVGEHHAGGTEDALFKSYVIVNRDVVLNLALIADDE